MRRAARDGVGKGDLYMKKIGWFFLINILLGLLIHFMPYALLSMEIKSEDACSLKFYYYTGDEKFRYDEDHQFEKKIAYTANFNRIFMVVPKTDMEKLRIDFLGNKGLYEIKNMVVYPELFLAKRLNAAQIWESFHKRNHLEQSISENGNLKLKILAEDAYLYGDTWTYEQKTNYTVLAIDLLLLLFLLCRQKKIVQTLLIRFKEKLRQAAAAHACFAEEGKRFVEYYQENKLLLFLAGIYLLFAYGFKVFNYTFTIDTEIPMFVSQMDGWIRDGRFGIPLLKWTMGSLPLVPYIANFMAVLALGFLGLLWNYVLAAANPKGRGEKNAALLFTVLFISYPSTAQYMNFATYNLEVTLGQIFAAIGVYLISQWIFHKVPRIYAAYGILFMVGALSVYQAMFTLYIVGCCVYALVHLSAAEAAKGDAAKRSLVAGKYVGTFLCGVLLYYLLHKLSNIHIQQFNYLDGFVGWGKLSFPVIADRLVLYAYDLLSGNSVYRGEFYGVSVVLGLLTACLLWRREPDKKRALFLLLIIGLLFFSPFLLPVAIGGGVPIRSQLALPLIVGVSVYLLYFLWGTSATIKRGLLLICLCVSFYQASGIATLFYGEYMKSQLDVAIAHQIAHEIEVVKKDPAQAKTVFFMGKYKPVFHQNAIRQQEMIGRSFFGHGDSNRIVLFMQSLGYGKIVPVLTLEEAMNFPQKRYEQVKRDARQMPAWPQQGSILEQEDLIIVKFSNDF